MGKYICSVLGYSKLTRPKMTRSRTSLRESQPGSPDTSEESSEEKSPKVEKTPSRGRKGQHTENQSTDVMDTGA